MLPIFTVSLRLPDTQPPAWDFVQSAIGSSADAAIKRAYESWWLETPQLPPLERCQSQAQPRRTALLRRCAAPSPQQSLKVALEKEIQRSLGDRLNGSFVPFFYPSGFNYGVTYGPNAYFNINTLLDVDTLLGTGCDGCPALTGGRFSLLYYQVLAAIEFSLSTADQETMAAEHDAAEATIPSVLEAFEGAGFSYGNGCTSKLKDAFDQLRAKYGGLDKLPESLKTLREAVAEYLGHAEASDRISGRPTIAAGRLAAAKHHIEAPGAANGGLQVSPSHYFVGYAVPKLKDVIAGLENRTNAVTVEITITNFSSQNADISVSGGPTFNMNCADILSVGAVGSAQGALVRCMSANSAVTMKITYPGITVFNSSPLELSTDNKKGWCTDDILYDVSTKTGKDETGYKFVSSEFSPDELFGEGGWLARIATFVISRAPEVTIAGTGDDIGNVAAEFRQQSQALLNGYSVLPLGAGGAFTVTNVEQKPNAVTLTVGDPDARGGTRDQVAFLLGGVVEYAARKVDSAAASAGATNAHDGG